MVCTFKDGFNNVVGLCFINICKGGDTENGENRMIWPARVA
jgi:hypothetical protein